MAFQYINNINSPGVFRYFDFVLQPASFQAPAITCSLRKQPPLIMPYCDVEQGLYFQEAVVEFWSNRNDMLRPSLSVVIHVPLHCNAQALLQIINSSVQKHKIIALVNSYRLNGVELSWNTINTIHHHFNFPLCQSGETTAAALKENGRQL
jgi:hypothetical protein